MEMNSIQILDSEDHNADLDVYGFYIKDSRYITVEKKGRNSITVKLSNFVMKSLFNLSNGTNDSRRILFIKRHSGEEHYIEVLSSEMKPEGFETILKSIRCTFLGTAAQLKMIFEYLMDNEDQAQVINLLGWNAEFRVYAFADAIYSEDGKILKVDDLGIIGSGKTKYWLPAFGFSNLANEEYKQQRLYKFSPGKTNFKTWAELFYQAYGKNGIIGIMFTIMSAFRDVIFDTVGFFPFLFLFGDAGTGKTQFTEKLLRLFGADVIGTSLNNATTPGLSRTASQKSNSLVYLKEYTNETEGNIQDFILSAYDGAGRTIGVKTTDTRTKTLTIRSGIIFDGNHLPTQKTAILMRMILLNFENNTFTDEQTAAFHKLKEYADYGFGNVLVEILKLRPHIENEFRETYLDVKNRFRRIKRDNVPERMTEHNSLIYALFQLTKDQLTFPFDDQQLFNILIENLESQNQILKENSAVFIFWEAFSFNVSKSFLEEYGEEFQNGKKAHFRIKVPDNAAEDEVILQIRYNLIYPHYVKYCRDNSQRHLDSSSLKKILTSDANPSFIRNTQKNRGDSYTDKKFGSCYQFTAKKRRIEDERGVYFDDKQITISGVTISL